MLKIVFLLAFVVAVGVLLVVKYAFKGIKAARASVRDSDQPQGANEKLLPPADSSLGKQAASERMRNEIPPFPYKFAELSRQVSFQILQQISAFEQRTVTSADGYDPALKCFIASYAWGFLCGYFQASNDDKSWWDNEAAPELALGASITSVAVGVFGPSDAMGVLDGLPQYQGRTPSKDVLFLEQVGGTDGMDFAAKKQSRWPEGGLHHFFINNVSRPAARG